MAEPIIELGVNSEIDENSDDELVLRNTDTSVEITVSDIVEILGGRFKTSTFEFSNTIENPEEEDPATGTVTIDVSTSNWYDPIAATEDITVEVENVDSGGNQLTLFFTDGDGMGPYTITWPSSFEWINGNERDEVPEDGNLEITAISPDGGSTWRARRSGQEFE